MTLTKSQAEAIYSAMCALNNVSGRVYAKGIQQNGIQDRRFLQVQERKSGIVLVSMYSASSSQVLERYASQSAFAKAYNLA